MGEDANPSALVDWVIEKYELSGAAEPKYRNLSEKYWQIFNRDLSDSPPTTGTPPNETLASSGARLPEQNFLQWVGDHYPGKLAAAITELQNRATSDHPGTDPYRPATAASQVKPKAEDIIATLIRPGLKSNELAIFKDICENYFNFIDALARPLSRPQEFAFWDSLRTNHSVLVRQAVREIGSSDVDQIMRWFANRVATNPQAREIFLQYLRLGRLEELQRLNSESSSHPPTGRVEPGTPPTPPAGDAPSGSAGAGPGGGDHSGGSEPPGPLASPPPAPPPSPPAPPPGPPSSPGNGEASPA